MPTPVEAARLTLFGPPPENPDLRVTAGTSDGRRVWGGVFYLHETHGVPIVLTLEQIQRHGDVPDVLEFVGAAHRAGCSYRKIIALIGENWGEAYGRQHADEVIQRLNATLALVFRAEGKLT